MPQPPPGPGDNAPGLWDDLPPTKLHYDGARPRSIQVRTCRLTLGGPGARREHVFDKAVVRIGSMADNDLVIADETVSREHCRIVQESTGYAIVDRSSTNGTFVNSVRVREALLTPGAVIHLGQTEMVFNAAQERVEVVPANKHRLADIIGRNVKMRELYAVIEKIAPTGATVVIEGETGTGKEVVAQTIHRLSPRSGQPLMVFDCGAVPKNLIESELFGHERGSFTGAIMTRQGLFEMADKGTLFLDELGELPLDLQPKLLRALEQREIRRVGGGRSIKVDARIIAATNRDLEEEVRAGRFRQDLFYRLSVVRLVLPPLRERREDIPLLVEAFLAEHAYNRLPGGGPAARKCKRVSPQALEALQAYHWPGNVRELVNAVERAVSFATSDSIDLGDLPDAVRGGSDDSAETGRVPRISLRPLSGESRPLSPHSGESRPLSGESRPASGESRDVSGRVEASRPPMESHLDIPFKDAKERWVSTFEREYIQHLLKQNRGNISHAARQADIDRKYFRKLMRKYAIEVEGAEPFDEED